MLRLALRNAWLWVALAGCAEPPFSLHVRDNNVADIERALASSQAGLAAPAGRTPRVYLVTPAPKHLVAYDMTEGRVIWDVAAEITSRVHVGRDFLVAREGPNALTVRSSADGQVRCTHQLPQGERLLGLTADDRVYYTSRIERLPGHRDDAETLRRHFLVGVDAGSCGVAWKDEADGSLGAPAVRGGIVAVPYSHQNAVILDGRNGIELARVRTTEEEINYVRATPEGIFFGSGKDIFLLDRRAASGTKKGSSTVRLQLSSEPFRVFYYWDGYQPAQVDYTAFDRNRLLWRAAPQGDNLAFRDGMAYLLNYRFLFALEAASGTMRWAYAHPRVDIVAAEDVGGSIVFVSADGDLGALQTKTGNLAWSKKTGLRVSGASFDAEGFALGEGGEAPSLAKALTSIVWDPDARFTAVKVFVVEGLAKLPGREITDALLQIVVKGGVAPAVAARAGEALVARKDASMAAEYRRALEQHYDFLADKNPHGVEYLARTAAAIGDTQAVPLLGRQLLDGLVAAHALKDIVRSLTALGGGEAVTPLRNFLLTYRCDPAFQADPAALVLAAEGLLKIGGPEGRRVVGFVAEEARTIPALTRDLGALLQGGGKGAAASPAKARSVSQK